MARVKMTIRKGTTRHQASPQQAINPNSWGGWLQRNRWNERLRQALSHAIEDCGATGAIGILMVVRPWQITLAEETVHSFLAQAYERWEAAVMLVDNHESPPLHFTQDERIKCMHLDQASQASCMNIAASACDCPFILPITPGDILSPDALGELAAMIATSPDAAIVYADEDEISPEGTLSPPHFKPPFSPHALGEGVLLGRPVAIRKEVAESVGWFREKHDEAIEHDIHLRITRSHARIAKVDRILCHRRSDKAREAKTRAAACIACNDHHACMWSPVRCTIDQSSNMPVATYPAQGPAITIICQAATEGEAETILKFLTQSAYQPSQTIIACRFDPSQRLLDRGGESVILTTAGTHETASFNQAAKVAAGDILIFLRGRLTDSPLRLIANLAWSAHEFGVARNRRFRCMAVTKTVFAMFRGFDERLSVPLAEEALYHEASTNGLTVAECDPADMPAEDAPIGQWEFRKSGFAVRQTNRNLCRPDSNGFQDIRPVHSSGRRSRKSLKVLAFCSSNDPWNSRLTQFTLLDSLAKKGFVELAFYGPSDPDLATKYKNAGHTVRQGSVTTAMLGKGYDVAHVDSAAAHETVAALKGMIPRAWQIHDGDPPRHGCPWNTFRSVIDSTEVVGFPSIGVMEHCDRTIGKTPGKVIRHVRSGNLATSKASLSIPDECFLIATTADCDTSVAVRVFLALPRADRKFVRISLPNHRVNQESEWVARHAGDAFMFTNMNAGEMDADMVLGPWEWWLPPYDLDEAMSRGSLVLGMGNLGGDAACEGHARVACDQDPVLIAQTISKFMHDPELRSTFSIGAIEEHAWNLKSSRPEDELLDLLWTAYLS